MSGIIGVGSRSGIIGQTEIDYEEGYHIPTVTPSTGTSSDVTMEANYKTVSYTKIGRQVTVNGQLAVQSVSSPVGYFKVSLPFAIAELDENAERGCASILIGDVASANVADFVSRSSGGTSEFFVYLGDGTGYQSDSAEQLQTNSIIYFTFTYFTS